MTKAQSSSFLTTKLQIEASKLYIFPISLSLILFVIPLPKPFQNPTIQFSIQKTMNTNNSASSTPQFDNLLLKSLISRSPNPLPFSAAKSLEELLFSDLLLNLSESDSDSNEENLNSSSTNCSKTQLAKEESRLEKEIVRIILSGEIEKLKPNSGQAVAFGEHHICVGFNEEKESDYRVWEWHGHIMLFDEEDGYTPEYIYGNYFERVSAAKMELKKKAMIRKNDDGGEKELEEEKVGNVGLKELIESGEPSSGHILHRNINASSGSMKFT